MGEEKQKPASASASADPSPSSPSSSSQPDSSPPFDPSRMIGIIKRKALIKDLAALYHTECLAYCQELLELQKKREEPFVDTKTQDNSRKEMTRLPKRSKKTR